MKHKVQPLSQVPWTKWGYCAGDDTSVSVSYRLLIIIWGEEAVQMSWFVKCDGGEEPSTKAAKGYGLVQVMGSPRFWLRFLQWKRANIWHHRNWWDNLPSYLKNIPDRRVTLLSIFYATSCAALHMFSNHVGGGRTVSVQIKHLLLLGLSLLMVLWV